MNDIVAAVAAPASVEASANMGPIEGFHFHSLSAILATCHILLGIAVQPQGTRSKGVVCTVKCFFFI